MVHAKDTQVHWFMNILFIRVPPNHQVIVLYLVLTDERCLNALLLAGLLDEAKILTTVKMKPKLFVLHT
jgi:hypothetical protein